MCPPGVDQTCRTTQQWHVLAPSCRQRVALGHARGSIHTKPLEFLRRWDRMGFGAFEKLVRLPGINSSSFRSCVGSQLEVRSTALSAIEALPAEMLALVLAQPELEAKDIINLGLCSTTLWLHTIQHIHRTTLQHLGSWAGKPLLCTGTYLTKLPDAIYDLLPDEREKEDQYRAAMKKYQAGPSMPGRGRIGRRWYGPCPARNWNWSAISEPEDEGFEDVGGKGGAGMWTQALRPSLQASSCTVLRQARLWRDVMDVVEPVRTTMNEIEDGWILRNLTTKQFFHLDVRQTYQGHGPQAFVQGGQWLSLDQALIMRIAWSSGVRSQTYDTELEGIVDQLGTGPWAGHCFDVVRADSQEHKAWIAEGEDVTEEILGMAEEINKYAVQAADERAEIRREYWAQIEARDSQTSS